MTRTAETHYHIMILPSARSVISNAVFESYEDSLTSFVALSREFFLENYEDPEALSFENAVAASRGGSGYGMFVGIPEALMVVWTRCEEVCESGCWN